jgi:8-amino-3,8-dideoxy-alpha-D-manno-octulosonate transaminase
MSGAPGAVHEIDDVARRHGLFLLEDCAQCAGGTVGGRSVGTFGDIAVFSFQMNKNMTSGEGGCVITNDDRLFGRMFASHDLGFMRDGNGRLIMDDPDLLLWGRGYRMDELRAAVLRVQLAKLPRITGAMRQSKQRIRAALAAMPEVKLRRLADPAGDTGCFLLTIFRDGSTAAAARDALRAEGIVTHPQGIANILLKDFGLHAYYNIASLVRRSSVEPGGLPWSHPANLGLGGSYVRGTCPAADDLFERTLMLPIPSCLTKQDEDDIIAAYDKVTAALAERREAS